MSQAAQITTLHEFPVPREAIMAIEQLIANKVDAGVVTECRDSIPLQHEFIPGAYARGMKVEAGTLLVGKIHRRPCFNFILSGKVVVFDEGGRKDISAPLFFVSPAGIKRVMYVVEELVWFNVHGTEETDLEALEVQLIAPTYADLETILIEEK